ncbi:MAG: SDR family NAD(P)-dependent oxidoreductase [Lautropia sp.]|nr:SDR family NAD(P)-dependent oxidoreductase [Lautropia sp.]
MNIKGKKVFVSGGTEGIGAAIVRQLLNRGAVVVTCARNEPAAPMDAGVFFKRCDLTVAQDRDVLVSWIRAEHSDLAVLINNAALQNLVDFPKTGFEEIQEKTRQELALNLEAPIMLSAALLPVLASQPAAAIVNVTTGLALAPKKSSPVYCATKAALRSFTRSLRYQVEESMPHIRVQEVLPPLVETRMTSGRGSGKMSPEAVATALLSAIEREVDECYVGKSKLLKVVMRVAPGVAYRILKGW